LIEAIRRRAGTRHPAWRVAIGDDAAVLRERAGRERVWTTDALVEDVHFRWRWTDARSLGSKSLAVSLSDLGAMGAQPLGFLLALALPSRARSADVEGFVSGLLGCARRAGCPLVGGDTVASPVWSITVSAVGEAPSGRALLRGGARERDRIFVTGSLGGAALGVLELRDGARSGPFVRRQLDPRPPLEAGPRLVSGRLATAAVDISDGLAQDLAHVAEASGLRAEVDLERVPLQRGLRPAAAARGIDPLALALHGGEDYELLFTTPPRAPGPAVLSRRLGRRVTEIGVMRRGRGVCFVRGGRAVEIPPHGWDHFKRSGGNSEA
jgi:thiamine-monophosphate kinase